LPQIENKNNEIIIKEAEENYKSKKYDTAYPIYKNIWENLKINDPYTLFKYGNVLRKNNLSAIFLEIYKNYDLTNVTEKQKGYINRILSWCLYDTFIKIYDIKDVDTYNDFISVAHQILEIQNVYKHNYYDSAYVKTCLKVSKTIMKRTTTPNYKEVIWWLELLEVDKLSDEPFPFKDKNDDDRELASDKETYYQYLSRSYEKINDYSKCYEICERAIEDIGKFHYRNHIWINERKLYCCCFIYSDVEKSLKEYSIFVEKNRKCYMFHKLANLNFSHGKIANSVLCGSKALLLETDIPKIVNLLADLAYYWREFGNSTNAKKFFYACIYYRVKRHWQLSQELNYEKQQYNFTFNEEPDFNELIQISNQYIGSGNKSKILSGRIININIEKQFGFIKQDSCTENIHFSFRNVIEKKVLHDNCRIIYEEIIDSRNMKDAINVRGE